MTPTDDNGEEDGWEDDDQEEQPPQMTEKDITAFPTKMAELKALQQQPPRKQSTSLSGTKRESSESERDLFIPLFAIVSLSGLFGAYGYEMIRLYLRGELYVPF
jgi:hypothetical protein